MNVRQSLLFTAIAAVIGLVSAPSQAGTITQPFTSNYQLTPSSSGTLTPDADDALLRVGFFNDLESLVITFELPDLGGETLTGADLRLAYRRNTSGIDPEAVDAFIASSLRSGDTVTGDDHIAPADDLNPSGWDLLQREFVTSSTSGGENVSLDATGQSNLLSFLQSNYVAGQFIAIALALDTNGELAEENGTARYEFDSDRFDGATFALDLTTEDNGGTPVIPTPAALPAGLAMMGMLALRRRK